MIKARKEEWDNYQTNMNIVDLACLSQSRQSLPYRVGRFGDTEFQTQKCSEGALVAAGQQQVHSLLLLLISQKDVLN